jgi:hypothetical protein
VCVRMYVCARMFLCVSLCACVYVGGSREGRNTHGPGGRGAASMAASMSFSKYASVRLPSDDTWHTRGAAALLCHRP